MDQVSVLTHLKGLSGLCLNALMEKERESRSFVYVSSVFEFGGMSLISC